MGSRFLVDFANFMYVNSHFVVTTAFLVWLYLRRNDHFYFVRNMFMVAMALALVGYAAMPTAPPRFLPELGFVDTIAYYADVKHDSAFVTLFFNPYAAVPSMHVAFSLMIAVPAVLLVRRRLQAAVGPLPAACDVRRDRDRQPLVVRRGGRSRGRADGSTRRAAGAVAPAPGGLGLAPALGVGDSLMAIADPLAGPRSAADGGRPRPRQRRRPRRRAARRRTAPSTARAAAMMRDRLIESRLTPNSISITGLVLNVAAAVLVTQRLFFLAGLTFIVGSLMDTLDGRYSRMSGKGTPFGAFLDSTLDRIEEGIVLTAVAAYFASQGDELAVAAVVWSCSAP